MQLQELWLFLIPRTLFRSLRVWSPKLFPVITGVFTLSLSSKMWVPHSCCHSLSPPCASRPFTSSLLMLTFHEQSQPAHAVLSGATLAPSLHRSTLQHDSVVNCAKDLASQDFRCVNHWLSTLWWKWSDTLLSFYYFQRLRKGPALRGFRNLANSPSRAPGCHRLALQGTWM